MANCRKYLVCAALVCVLAQHMSATVFSCMRHLTVDDGLSQNMVYCISQDANGYMWFGTQDGLDRFDGNDFTIYKNTEDSYSVGSKGFFSMLGMDDGSIWLGTTDGVRVYDPTMERFRKFSEKTPDGLCVEGNVRTLVSDGHGGVWMGCQSGMLFYWHPDIPLRSFCLGDALGIDEAVNIRSMALIKERKLYVATHGCGLVIFDLEDSTAVSVHISEAYSGDVNALCPLEDGSVLVGTSSDGVLRFDPVSRGFMPFIKTDGDYSELFVRSLMKCSDGLVWIGTESGLYIYDAETCGIVHMSYSAGDPYSLSDNAVYAIYEDRDDGVWIGTYFGGVNYITKSAVFERYYPIPGRNSVGGRCISEFAKDSDGYLYIGTEDAGLYRFEPRTKKFRKIPLEAGNIHALMHEDGRLFVGSFSEGLFLIDLSSMKVVKRWRVSDGNIGCDDIYAVSRDSYGRLWVGAMSGLFCQDSVTGRFEQVLKGSIEAQVNDVMEDSDRNIWVASYGGGLWRHDAAKDEWKCYYYEKGQVSESGRRFSCILEDGAGRIWAGTDGDGLYLYDRATDSFTVRFNSHTGLLNDVIYSLKCDNMGNVWGSTNKGLFRIDAATLGVVTYTHESGLLCDQFNYKSGFADSDGTMYFGSIRGFVSFRPEDVGIEKNEPCVFINSLEIDSEKVTPVRRHELVVPYGTSAFSLGMVEINYAPSHNNVYYYMLEGWDSMWFAAEMPYKASYSNLPPGNYCFKVRCSAEDGADNLISLDIVVKPPVWNTWWAWVIYVVTASFMVWLAGLMLRKRRERRNREELKALEDEKEKEIHRAKMEFFTNITHEIRTPLSLIRLPLEKIIENTSSGNEQYGNLLMIRDNVDRLLELVNQLLDFRNVSGESDVRFLHADIVPVIIKTVERFRPAAAAKGIGIKADLPDSLWADVDVEMLTKMTSNLLTNALKHASTLIRIVLLKGEDNTMGLSVINDGDMIPRDESEKIFNPFYKLDRKTEGLGIGLPFVRSLAQMHAGRVFVAERSDEMTEFRIELPLWHEGAVRIAHPEEKHDSSVREQDDGMPGMTNIKRVLIIDDDASFVEVMGGQLSAGYKVSKARTAEEAMACLGRRLVDVVITDIRLPDMDGIELLKKLKQDRRHKDIPVIVLTGDALPETKAAAISAGAAVYIEKPCYIEYLTACIENLFKGRYMSDAVKKRGDVEMHGDFVYTKEDEKFMDRLTELIYGHLEEVDLDVNRLASMLNMSRATLYRKVKETLRITPNDFIRIIRLKKAAELLRSGEYRINEIAYIVGFSSSSYFSKSFKKYYGVLPKDFR